MKVFPYRPCLVVSVFGERYARISQCTRLGQVFLNPSLSVPEFLSFLRIGCCKLLLFFGIMQFLWPPSVLAHAGHRGYVMLLPTQLYMIGGGLVVALTFAAVLVGLRIRESVPSL